MRSRAATAAVGVVGSLVVSALAWWYFDTLLVFLVVPFVPVLFRRTGDRAVRTCPQCGFSTADESVAFCPRDGERLETRERR